MSEITLSRAVRSNLLNLQSTADLLSRAQERLSTGLRVNSAIDNPTNFFTALGLNSRAGDLSQLLDSVSTAIQTINAADTGITSITKLVETAQATARQALQTSATLGSAAATAATSDLDTTTIRTAGAAMSFGIDVADGSVMADTYLTAGETLSISNGASTAVWHFTLDADSGTAPEPWAIVDTFSLDDILGAISQYMDGGGDDAEDFSGTNFSWDASSGRLVISLGDDTTSTLTVAGTIADELGLAGTYAPVTSGEATAGDITINGQTISLENGDEAAQILSKLQLAASASSGADEFTVSNTGGVLTITGANGNSLDIGGDAETLAALGLDAGVVPGSGVNPKRAELVATYNDVLSQITALAKDSGYNGVNLLNGDSISVLFNEDGSSKLDITGEVDDATTLGLTTLDSTAFNTNSGINDTLDDLREAVDNLRVHATKLGSSLSVIQTRREFTSNMIDVLQKGASNLTLADANTEAADVLALQTRQQLSSTALSLASQADQNVLRLF